MENPAAGSRQGVKDCSFRGRIVWNEFFETKAAYGVLILGEDKEVSRRCHQMGTDCKPMHNQSGNCPKVIKASISPAARFDFGCSRMGKGLAIGYMHPGSRSIPLLWSRVFPKPYEVLELSGKNKTPTALGVLASYVRDLGLIMHQRTPYFESLYEVRHEKTSLAIIRNCI